MSRYTPDTVDGTLFLVGADDRVEIGAVDDVVAAVGGETYTIEYDQRQRKQPWLRTDEGELEIDVREAVTTLSHGGETVSEIRASDLETDRYGLPTRTVEFADTVVEILERQGSRDA
ncbi:hypothetical protein [Halorubrum lipolyticum]|uniref:Uncharacterized protein n=1 Tax=Halorubrum lipolyticum DSM 21995 TaxID=1227482 RepID=M0NSS4_9EURY|nr:hypothetical protein [Halorubrum lipolyticum]EMA59670.1 hypothetical protein C469_10121 [Halorubrum lipolyticum DSM 21995]